jgi:hypothetical protein
MRAAVQTAHSSPRAEPVARGRAIGLAEGLIVERGERPEAAKPEESARRRWTLSFAQLIPVIGLQ